MYNCGLIPDAERIGPGFPQQAGWPERTDAQDYPTEKEYWDACNREVCPGYLATLPQVIEAARALPWFEKGCLDGRLDGEQVTGLLVDSLDILSGEVRSVESFAMSEAESK